MSSLKEILNQLAAIDAEDETLDPAEVIGDLNGKVDGIKAKIDEWEAESARLDTWKKQIEQRQSVYKNAMNRLLNYVEFQMKQHDYEKLPGEIWEIKWKKNPPRVEIDEPASAKLFLQYKDYISQKTSYNYDKKKIKDAIKDGQKFPFAHIEQDKKITIGVKKK